AASVAVVGHYGGDSGRARATGRIQHEQQFHYMFLHWWNQGLNDKDVLFAAVCLQLYLQAIVAEPHDIGGRKGSAQLLADLLRQVRVRPATKDRNTSHTANPRV